MNVRKAVAGGYVRVGRAREALALYKTVPLQDATAGDFQGAIGAALAANDRTLAEIWLRQALDRYPAIQGFSHLPLAMSRSAATTSAPPIIIAPLWLPCRWLRR